MKAVEFQDLLEIIKTRRSIRAYKKDAKIPSELLEKVLEAGLWSPTSSNVQPWEFIVVKEKANLMKVKALSPGIFGYPDAIIILAVNKERAKRGGPRGAEIALMDLAMAAQNMMLEAHYLGLGSCPVLSFSKEGIKELLETPEQVEPALMLTLGYPAESPSPPKRRSLDEVVHYEKY